MQKKKHLSVLGGSSVGYIPSYKWINPTYPPEITGDITYLLSGMIHQVGHVPELFSCFLPNHQHFSLRKRQSGGYLAISVFVKVAEEPQRGVWGEILGKAVSLKPLEKPHISTI